jgi:hypothetical protein
VDIEVQRDSAHTKLGNCLRKIETGRETGVKKLGGAGYAVIVTNAGRARSANPCKALEATVKVYL